MNAVRAIATVLYHFVIAAWRTKEARYVPVKDWEITADNLSKAGRPCRVLLSNWNKSRYDAAGNV